MKAFEHFLVIVFRDQDLTPEQHKAFSRYFGAMTELPQAPIYRRPSRHAGGAARGARAGERRAVFDAFPHRQSVPAAAAALRRDARARGAEIRRRHRLLQQLSGLRESVRGHAGDCWTVCRWSIPARTSGRTTPSCDPTSACACAKRMASPKTAREHPPGGAPPPASPAARRSTSPPPISSASSAGARRKAAALLNYLQSLPHRLHYQCRIRWKQDTCIVWDNRFLQHCGIHDYANERRHLIRTTVIGEPPE